MTDRAQFEAMLEALINEDHESAKEIFHNIVVGKSREIYEELLAEDFSPEEANRAAGGHMHSESSEEEEEEGAEEGEEPEDDSEEPEDDGEEDPFGGEDDGEDGEEDGEEDDMGGDSDLEAKVYDLEDALEDLKAEFEQLMAGEEAEEHDHPGIHDMGGADADMGGDMGPDDMGAMGEPDELETMMEYVNKVGNVQHGDNGQNTKSIIDNMKNDMGGTTANIAQNFSTTTGGTQGGLAAPTTKPLIGKVQNSPDAKAGKTAFKKQEPGHGAEKKGKGEMGGTDKKSLIGGRIR